jgi:hypothetical protein
MVPSSTPSSFAEGGQLGRLRGVSSAMLANFAVFGAKHTKDPNLGPSLVPVNKRNRRHVTADQN